MPEGDIRTNAAGDQVILRGGQWVPVVPDSDAFTRLIAGQTTPRDISAAQEALIDFGQGTRTGAGNILETLGLVDETAERTAREQAAGARSPIAAALGEGSAAAITAIPGALGGEALAAMLGFRALGTFILSSLGSGATAQIALDETGDNSFIENIVTDFGIDTATAAALGFAGRVPSMAVRVFNAIRKGGTFKRQIKTGDLPGSSAELVQKIQDQQIPLTTAQASGDTAELLQEGSLRRNPFQIGPGFPEIDRLQQEAINEAAARAIGLPPGTKFLDGPTLATAKKAIGENIEAVVNVLPDVPIQKAWIDQLTALSKTRFINKTGQSGLAGIAGDLQAKLNARELLTATEWKRMRELISQELGAASGANVGILGQALDIVDGMPDVPPALLARYGAAREQWRTLLSLEKGATVSAEGNVNVGQLNRNFQNSFGNVTSSPSRTAATQNIRELSEAFSTRRMSKGPTSGTAENLAAARAVEQLADVGAAITTGDPTGIARGGIIGTLNALGSPLHLGQATSPDLEQLLRAFGITGAAALQQEISGNN